MASRLLKASDIMTKEVVIAHPDMSLVEVAKLMNQFRIGGVPVMAEGELVGAVTERTIMQKVVEADVQPSKVFVRDIMTPPKIVVGLGEDVNAIARRMAKEDVTRVFVCDDGKLAGIITNKDVLKHSHEQLNILIEQAKIKGPQLHQQYTAYGKCERCGTNTHLLLKEEMFVCGNCFERL